MTFSTDLYEQRIDEMKARECRDSHTMEVRKNISFWRACVQRERNTDRLAAYKRKRADHFGSGINDCVGQTIAVKSGARYD